MFRSFVVILVITLLTIMSWPTPTLSQPYPDSTAITDVTYEWSTHDRRADGSDNWPVTWMNNDNQLTSFGDGGGFGGSNQNGRVSLGFSIVSGSANNYTGTNVWGGFNSANSAQFDGKSYGLIDINGALYAWWGPGSNGTSYNETRLLESNDLGASWQQSSWDMTNVDSDLIMPTILNFGRGYAGSRDDYVYHYFIKNEQNNLGIHKSDKGRIYLARVPKNDVMNLNAYEWFTGMSNGDPSWSGTASQKAAVFEDSNGVGWNLSVSYNAGLRRYILMTEHSESFKGYMGMFDAPEPWGPWTTVVYHQGTDHFGAGEIDAPSFYWNFSNKWLSADGKSFVMVFSGVSVHDSWNTVEGSFNATTTTATIPGVAIVEE